MGGNDVECKKGEMWMKDEILKLTIGGLLHDIGKVVQRADCWWVNHSQIGTDWLKETKFTEDDDILHQVLYHHKGKINEGHKLGTEISPLAYITYIADNIASGTESQLIPEDAFTDFDSKTPLQSIFTLLNGKSDPKFYKPTILASGVNYPRERECEDFKQSLCEDIVAQNFEELQELELSNDYINSLLDILEKTLSFVPASVVEDEITDVSLYDHLKLTAAIGCCIYGHLDADENFKETLFINERNFHERQFAMLYSFDISGIQDFIYTIHSKDALKTLRARSFYLEILAESIIDDILETVGLSRANLLYSGGGHAYLLLPYNGDREGEILFKVEKVIKKANKWLLEKFGEQLYVASGYGLCSSNILKERPEVAFNEANSMISEKKLRRYSFEDINYLNGDPRIEGVHTSGEECRICKTIERNMGEELTCTMCKALIDFKHKDFYVITDKPRNLKGVQILKKYLVPLDEEQLCEMLEEDTLIRYYGRNKFYKGRKLVTKIWVGDHEPEKELNEYVEKATGIDRLAVLRMDVDNLGAVFTDGFGEKYRTISRVTTLSRFLSMFFKHDINEILKKGQFGIEGPYKITVIYSGGDDVFLIGSWDDVYKFAVEFRESFKRFTQGKLTISAGLGLYPGTYPIHLMARETGELEKVAKANEGKDSITLFMPELTFKWAEFDGVLNKLCLLNKFVQATDSSMAFLHKMLRLLNEETPINLARLAYTLATRESNEETEKKKQQYQEFNRKIYDYAQPQNGSEKKQLIAAIYLHLYTVRQSMANEEGIDEII